MIVDELVERPRADGESFGVGPWVGRVEREIPVERERAVFVSLIDSPELGVVVADPELHVVVPPLARVEPGVIVLDLIVAVPGALRLGAGLREEARVGELRRTEGLIALRLLFEREAGPSALRTLSAEAGVAVPPVLPRPRHANGIDASVAEHARHGAHRGLIEVGLVLV